MGDPPTSSPSARSTSTDPPGLDAPSVDPAAAFAGHPNRWRILVVLCAALCVVVLDNTILAVAVPRVGHDLHADETALQWITTAYSLVLAAFLLPLAGLGDRFGRRGLLLAGLVVFGASSGAAAMAASSGQLILARGIQGIGGAATMPATLAVLGNVFPEHERPRAIALWSGMSALAGAAGPVIGGLLLDHFWWGSVFLVNVPFCVMVFVAVVALVPTSKDPAAPPIDLVGSVVWSGALGLLLFGVIEGPVRGWSSAVVLGSWTVGVTLLVAFAGWERRSPHPLLSPKAVADRRMQAGMVAMPAVFFSAFGVQFVVSQWLQGVHRFSPLLSGACFVPHAFSVLGGSLLSTRLVRRIGLGRSSATGLAVLAGALGFGALFHGSIPPILVAVVFVGLGIGLTCPPSVELIMAGVPPEQAGQAAGVNETLVEAGGAFGIAVMGSVLAAAAGGAAAIAPARLAGSSAAAVAARHTFTTSLTAPLVTAFVVLLVGAVVVIARTRGTDAWHPVDHLRDVVGAPEGGVIVVEPQGARP